MKSLNSNHLKLIAIFAMTVDHLADLIYPGFPASVPAISLHIIGRLTAPMMWFFVSEGFYYTSDKNRYLMRLFLFAVISHFAYCFAFGIAPILFQTGIFNQTSVMYSLFVGAAALWIQHSEPKIHHISKQILLILLIMSAFPADWSCIGALVIIHMYHQRGDLKKQMSSMMIWVSMYALVSFFFVNKIYGVVQFFVILVYPFLKLYHGERGRIKCLKWFFYLYYPLHLVVIGFLRIYLYGDIPLLF